MVYPQSTRRELQYWLAIALSLAIPAAALFGEASNATVVMNAALVSLGLLGFGGFALLDWNGVLDIGQVACGLWLATSALWLDYSDSELRYVHLLLGASVALLAIYNRWRDTASALRRG